jgi:HAMP domain-containing protein
MRWENHGRFGPIRASLRMKVTLGVIGSLLLVFSGIAFIQVTRHETAAISWENVLSMAGAVIASVLVVNLVLNWSVLKRLNALTTVVISFDGGRRHLRFPDNGVDEIGRLTEAFNDMGRHIETKEAENRVLSDDLSQQSMLRGQLLERLITAQED